MLRHLGPTVATAIVVLFLLVSSIPLMHWFTEEGRSSTLSENRGYWQDLGISSYRMGLEFRDASAEPPIERRELRVRDGRATATRNLSGIALPTTINEVFDYADTVIQSAPYSLEITYDPDYRFPREIRIDPDADVVGDEIRMIVTEFDPRVEASNADVANDGDR